MANSPLRLVPVQRRRGGGAGAADVAELVDDWPDAYLACRSGNHHWTPFTVEDARTFWLVTEKCPRCTATREWDMNPQTGEQYGAKRINYPDNYLAKGVGRFGEEGRNLVRRESVLRNAPRPKKLSADDTRALHPHKATRDALGLEAG